MKAPEKFRIVYEDAKFVIIDLFCGGGGVSKGFEDALINAKRIAEVIACVNHDALCIRSHKANFPNCKHYTEDVRTLDVTTLPRKEAGDGRIWILWASLECTHFSNAKTGSRDADSRTLANALFPYIDWICPDLIMIENVREFKSWGPLTPRVVKAKKGMGEYCPIKFDKKKKCWHLVWVPEDRKKGIEYIKWRQNVESRGYLYNSKLLNSADYGSHQSRLRYFAVFTSPTMPVCWPERTHDKFGRHGLPKWKAVREVLELQQVGESIFGRKKPLSDNTLKRILAGLVKFVSGGQEAYLVKHYGGDPESKAVSLDNPGPTITTKPHESLVTAEFLYQYNGTPDNCTFGSEVPCRTLTTKDRFGFVQAAWIDHANRNGQPTGIEEPAKTVVTEPRQSIVQAWIDNRTVNGKPTSLEVPSPTIVTDPTQSMVTAQFIDNQYGTGKASSVEEPSHSLPTVPKKNLITAAFLDRQFGNSKGASLEEPCGTLATEPKTNLVSATFLMPTNFSNEPVSIESPCPTITANRKWHYLVNVQPFLLNNVHQNKGSSLAQPAPTLTTGVQHYLVNPAFGWPAADIEKPCFTLIARMDKAPPYLVSIDVAEGENFYLLSREFFKDEEIPVMSRIRAFMVAYNIKDIFMRMLFIVELKRIQGLGDNYILLGSQEKQKKAIGNAVVPVVVTSWVTQYYRELFAPNTVRQYSLFE